MTRGGGRRRTAAGGRCGRRVFPRQGLSGSPIPHTSRNLGGFRPRSGRQPRFAAASGGGRPNYVVPTRPTTRRGGANTADSRTSPTRLAPGRMTTAAFVADMAMPRFEHERGHPSLARESLTPRGMSILTYPVMLTVISGGVPASMGPAEGRSSLGRALRIC